MDVDVDVKGTPPPSCVKDMESCPGFKETSFLATHTIKKKDPLGSMKFCSHNLFSQRVLSSW